MHRKWWHSDSPMGSGGGPGRLYGRPLDAGPPPVRPKQLGTSGGETGCQPVNLLLDDGPIGRHARPLKTSQANAPRYSGASRAHTKKVFDTLTARAGLAPTPFAAFLRISFATAKCCSDE